MSKDHAKGSFGLQDEGGVKLDHQTRNKWIDRDERLHALWHESGMTRDEFIQHNQGVIDAVIIENSGHPRSD